MAAFNDRFGAFGAEAHDDDHEDMSIAILTKTKKANSLIITNPNLVDNSIIAMSAETLDLLKLERGDTVLVRGKKRKDTVLIAMADDTLDLMQASVNRVVRNNLAIYIGDTVSIYPCPNIKYVTRVEFLPLADTVEGLTGSLFDSHLAPYFRNAYRPVRQRDRFIVRSGMRPVEFEVDKVEPPEWGIVAEDTVIYCEGEPIPRGKDTARHREIGYDDIGGYQKQIAQVRELIELPLRHPLLFQHIGIDPPRGLLIHGPPGTGKTYFGRAIANETGAYLFLVHSSEILASNDPSRELRRIFEDAEKNSPAIIFIEDVDFIAPSRERPSADLERRVLSQLLGSIDGFKGQADVVVIGTSNNPEGIDPALRRFGRLGFEVSLGMPDLKDRHQILKIQTRNMRLATDVDLETIATSTHGYVGSDLAALCVVASMQQIRRKLPLIDLDEDAIDAEVLDSLTVNMEDFRYALDTVIERRFQG